MSFLYCENCIYFDDCPTRINGDFCLDDEDSKADKNVVDYDLPDFFTVFIDLDVYDGSDFDNSFLLSVSDLSLSEIISIYLDCYRDFRIQHIPWNEIDPWFDGNDCLIFGA